MIRFLSPAAVLAVAAVSALAFAWGRNAWRTL